jgi:2-polyprenyl-6-hydroxyphenyl methylase / 3-demethylubiquinone-9 3-methyltransferase
MEFGDQVHDYFETPGTVSKWWTPDEGPMAFHYDAELEVLAHHLPVEPGMKVLDLGTGRGRFGVWFAERGCDVVAVDLNPDMVAITQEAANARGVTDRMRTVEGSAEDLSAYDAGSFDVVACMELFDHLPDLRAVLGEVTRVLRPGGRFTFTYVPSESLYGALGNAYRRVRGRRGERIISRTYARREVKKALTAAGLELDGYYGIGLLCVSAQTRLFQNKPLVRASTAIARAEARFKQYYSRPWIARHGAHVVGIARKPERAGN